MESAEAFVGRGIGEQSSQRLPSPIAGGEQARKAATADTRLILQGQCQGRGRVPRPLAEQGEHARKWREQRRGDEHRGAAREERLEHGLESEQAQRQGPHGPEDPVVRQFVRSEREVEQHGEDIGPVFQRAEREVSLFTVIYLFVSFRRVGGLVKGRIWTCVVFSFFFFDEYCDFVR